MQIRKDLIYEDGIYEENGFKFLELEAADQGAA